MTHRNRVSTGQHIAMGVLSVIGLYLGTNSRKLAFVIITGLAVTLLFVTVGRHDRIVMLAQTSPSSSSWNLTSVPSTGKLITCSIRNSSSVDETLACFRYEVYVVQTEIANRSNMADVNLLKQLFTESDCRMTSSYHVHVVYYKDSGARPVSETTTLLNDSIQRCRAEGTSVRLDFIELSGKDGAVSTLDKAMTDAYVLHNIDFVSVIFAGEFDDRSLQVAAVDFVRTLAKSKPRNVGAIFQNGAAGSTIGRVFFSRNHFEIFGFYLPQKLTELEKIPMLFEMLYLEHQLTVIGPNGGVTSDARKISKFSPSEMSSLQSDLPEFKDTLNRYVRASAFNPCLRCLNRTSRHVIAMSLYGSDPRYTMGAIRNAQLLPVVFPGWRLWFYVEKRNPSGVTKYSGVPDEVLAKLLDLGAEVVWIDLTVTGLAPMLWRFTVMDSDDVDVFTVRDCDSRLTPRDAAVVSDWLKTDRLFHCIRDHPSHSSYAVSGGLWGARRQPFQKLVGNLRKAMKRYGAGYVEDMNFLGRDVWPKVVDHAYCHDSFSCDRFPSSHPFPVARIGSEHLGEVYDQHSVGRQGDINILKHAAVNRKCVPSK